MVVAVSYPAQRKPIVVGKPQPPMFEELKKAHNLKPDRCVMVGDRSVNCVNLPVLVGDYLCFCHGHFKDCACVLLLI